MSTNEDDIEMNIHLNRFVNLFTELGVAYGAVTLSRKAIKSIATLVVSSWEKLEYYIKEVQEMQKPYAVHNSFERLYLFVKRKRLHKIE